MSSSNKFVVNHWLKLSWKILKHNAGVALMLSEKEGAKHHHKGQSSRDKTFMNYLDSSRWQ